MIPLTVKHRRRSGLSRPGTPKEKSSTASPIKGFATAHWASCLRMDPEKSSRHTEYWVRFSFHSPVFLSLCYFLSFTRMAPFSQWNTAAYHKKAWFVRALHQPAVNAAALITGQSPTEALLAAASHDHLQSRLLAKDNGHTYAYSYILTRIERMNKIEKKAIELLCLPACKIRARCF